VRERFVHPVTREVDPRQSPLGGQRLPHVLLRRSARDECFAKQDMLACLQLERCLEARFVDQAAGEHELTQRRVVRYLGAGHGVTSCFPSARPTRTWASARSSVSTGRNRGVVDRSACAPVAMMSRSRKTSCGALAALRGGLSCSESEDVELSTMRWSGVW